MSGEMKNAAKDVQERIRSLAYMMWESAGRQQNMALQYWLNAEREIFSSMQAATEVIMPARTQRRAAAQEPTEPALIVALDAPADGNESTGADNMGQGLGAETQATGRKLALAESHQPAEIVDKSRTETAAAAPAGKPATRRTAVRKKKAT
jgi:hypothetical protein